MNLVISVSGGKTSAYMAYQMLKHRRNEYDEVICIFSNTGQENQETLRFVDKCDKAFGLNLVWIEAVTHHNKRRGCTHQVVNFDTANRDGSVFEDMIRKYGIPNKKYPHCTRELKINPINSYLRSVGWKKGSYVTAVGIRADEMDRVSSKMVENHLIYPLCEDFKTSKDEIDAWWSTKPFTLHLRNYQGNCKWCWKKTKRKLLTIAKESPGAFDFPARMEAQHGLAGHNVDGTKRTFFRENLSALDILQQSDQPFRIYEGDPSFDYAGHCSESCEVY